MASGHHESHGSGFTQDPWMGLGQSYSPQVSQHGINTVSDYQNFDYQRTPMPLEPAYTMPRPPPYAAAHHHPIPPPLVMPQSNVVWPSMLASQGSYQTPILPANSMHTPVSAAPSHSSDVTPTSAKSTSRRKLTDDERRQMCLEAEQNPTMKQTQIGAKFNVERSTVSKILRQKEKYMNPAPKEEVTSPGKKTKVKLPDVEKTLANWVRNQQRKNIPITDEELRKQAHMFAASRNDQQFLSTSTWLEQFRQKHVDAKDDPNSIVSDAGLDMSPVSSIGLMSPPMSSVEDRTLLPKFETSTPVFDFDNRDSTFDHSESLQPSPALDMGTSADATLTPLSPDLSRGDGFAIDMTDNLNATYNFSRQRSLTFHHLPDAAEMSISRAVPKIPMLSVRSNTSTSLADQRAASVNPRHTMKRHKSVPDIHEAEAVQYSSMQPPPLPRSADLSPISNPGSPSVQDDNIRALYSIQKLLEQRPDVAEPSDYVMIGRLMQKLKLLGSPNGTPVPPSGLPPREVAQSPRLSKKRTIIGISQ